MIEQKTTVRYKGIDFGVILTSEGKVYYTDPTSSLPDMRMQAGFSGKAKDLDEAKEAVLKMLAVAGN